MKPYILFSFIFIVLIATFFDAKSQVVFESGYHSVYSFLSRLAQKGIIQYNDEIQPLSKDYIYAKLDELSKQINELTPLEREELAFYLKEYTLWWRNDPKSGFDGTYKTLLQTKIGDRFRVYGYQDKLFTLSMQPIVGFNSNSVNGYSLFKSWKGFSTYGYLGKHLGFSLDFRATSETGRLGDYLNQFNNKTGVIGTMTDFKTFNYNESNVSITGSWNWGNVTLGKNYMPLGYGNGGKIILSDKAPSAPQFRIDLTPVKWLSFNYAHFWLNSQLADSTTLKTTSIPGRLQYEYRSKYFATHSVTFRPSKKVSFLIGESVVYSDKEKVEFLIPISLFSAMSHYMGELSNNTISNSQIYSQISLRNIIRNTHLYTSFFIDELRLNSIEGDSTSSRNHTAYQVGLSVTDWPFKNLFLNVEYTKVQPFAYVHFIQAQTYQNNSYNLGHWIGPNADQFYAQLMYRIKRGLELKLIYQFVRKGTVGTGEQQVFDNKYKYSFLWGDLQHYTTFESQLSYEIVHDLFAQIKYYHMDNFNTKTGSNNLSDQFSLGLTYGF